MSDISTAAPKAPEVNAFYEARPFPGYMPDDDASTLLDRSRRSPFLRALDAAIAPDARILEVGCGTGQLSNFLALSGPRRRMIGADLCRASLAAGEGFRSRANLRNLVFVRADLFNLPTRSGPDGGAGGGAEFDVVISRGVVHHTPDPDRASRQVAARVRPGGILVLGFYESIARLPHHTRRVIALNGRHPWPLLDPVLRRRDLDADKKLTWIEDQYRHPLESSLSFAHMYDVMREEGLRWVCSVPPACDNLFAETPEPSRPALTMRRWGWAWRCLWDEDAGLVCLVMRRPGPSRG